MLKERIYFYLSTYSKQIIIVIGSLIVIIIIFSLLAYPKIKSRDKGLINEEVLNVNLEIKEEEIKAQEQDIIKYYYVDIKGAIANPGVYQLKSDSRVVDVIKKAGGLTKEADTTVLNLSKKISDEMTIIIYTKKEIGQFRDKINTDSIKEITDYAKKELICPDPVINQACINDKTEKEKENNSNGDNVNGKVSINNADAELLQTLPGIGAAKAEAIIEYRNSNGLFTSLEAIKEVSGIGDSTFDSIKDHITL